MDQKEKIALFPGSFDPITLGHINIIERSLPLFDKIIIGIGNNSQKNYLFPLEKRIKWIQKLYEGNNKIKVQDYNYLTIEFCKDIKASYLIRGLRNSSDFEFEKNIAQLNQSMAPEIETVLLTTKPELSHISSTIVREIIRYKGNVHKMLPAIVLNDLGY